MSVSTLPAKPAVPDRPESTGDLTAVTTDHKSDADHFSAPRMLVWIVVALIPFWAVPIAHLCSNSHTATGFFHYELPYYVANGRAAFERGNGIVYPNPYDPSANAPAIYAHWLPWTLGLLTATFGFDPGDVILIFTFCMSLAFAWATRELVVHRVKSEKQRSAAFLLAMWGGGILATAGTVSCLFGTQPWIGSALQFDPGNGLWFLNWGRNAVFPTEAVYHTLVVGCWLAEIRRRYSAANICLLLLATTHPWSGLELLLTINLWRAINVARNRNRSAVNQLSISATTLILFLGYYKLWLPAFAQHAELQNVWELNWSVSWTSATFAYLPILVPCIVLIRQRIHTSSLTRTEQFLLCALCVSVGLAFHDRLIKPVQPIHFTRGYIWMPLFLLGLPVILRWWDSAKRSSAGFVGAALLIATLFVADNAVFAIVHSQRQFHQQDGFHLDTDERALCSSLQQLSTTRNSIVLTDSETLNYLLPTYASVRPWLGHHFNTPDYPKRLEVWQNCFQGNSVSLDMVPLDVELIVVRCSRDARPLVNAPQWQAVNLSNAEWRAWRRATGK